MATESKKLLSREEIEKAMDAFDDSDRIDFFKSFGEPGDSWVRSTKERDKKVYPAKPIVGYVLNKQNLNEDWSRPESAVSQLHNAGFIIVDKDDNPDLPENFRDSKYDHLVIHKKQADYIRLCALNYYIMPARERGEHRFPFRPEI